MIYFFNNDLQLQKVVLSANLLLAQHEHELNNLIRADVAVDLSYAKSFIDDVDHFGYYYKDVFYLHKIQSVEDDHANELLILSGRHIFFDDMLFGPLIRDVRPQNQNAQFMLNQTVGTNTRWDIVMTDTTGTLSTNFYWVPPYEAIEWVTENFRLEYLPVILFDGQNINGYQLHVKKRIGEQKHIRIPWGERVEQLTHEIDYSEIITKLSVRGKGEEVGDGYGRRINISGVNFSRNGVVSPSGSRYLEDPDITATYGNDGQTPREGDVTFEDIEVVSELVEAGYQHYLDVSRPQVLISADVAQIGDVAIGDGVLIIRREHDLYFEARVHKKTVDLLNPEDAQVELGDYKHFKESKIARKTREKNNRVQGQLSDRITRLKLEANERFDNEVTQWKSEYEQALIDVHAEIEADRENMTNLIEGTRTEFTDNLNIEITQTKEYAEQQAQEKAEAVRTDLGTVTSGHQAMLQELETNVMNIDDFIGDKTVSLNELLYNERMLFEERINSINTWHYNLLKETQTLDDEFWEASNGEIVRSSPVSYFRKTGTANISTLRSKQEMFFEAGETYTLTFEVQTFGHRRMDYVWILNRDTTIATGNYNLVAQADEQNAQVIYFGSEYRRYFITFTMKYDFYGVIQIGGNATNNEIGHSEYRIRKPYLTQSDNRNWFYHPDDNTQSIEEITRRITQLEDGREEFITRTQYDFETGEIEGSIKNIIETVDESTLIMQNHENWILTNGASIERTVDGFDSKAWLSDIHNPNMIPHSRFVNAENIDMWDNWSAPLLTKYGDEWLRVRNMNTGNNIGAISPKIPDKITAGESYTITWEAFFNISESRISRAFDYMYIVYSNNDNQGIGKPIISGTKNVTVGGVVRLVNQYELTFTAHHSDNNASILFGTTAQSGLDSWFFMRHPKLELGDRATPYYNAYSMFSQRADSIALQVDDQKSRISNFTVDLDGILGRVSDIEGDYITQSSLEITPDYAQIGSMRIDGDTVGSLLRVSPSGIDAVAEAMRLSGDLYVDGDITSLAVDAIEGNFARLFANQLTANVITADHIQVGTVLIDKFFATSARIDQLITKTHFVNEMHALTLNVVDLNASQIRTRLLTANTIEASWIKSGTALLDRVFASTAMFERMMAKSAFVTTLSTITLDLHELTIWRPDGVAYVQNGVPKFSNPIDVKPWPSTSVEYDARNYTTSARGAQTFERAYCEHAGRYAIFEFQPSMRWDSQHASTLMYIIVRPSTVPSGVNLDAFYREEFIVYRDRSNSTVRFTVPLSAPTYGALSFTLEFGRVGDNTENFVQVRSNRCRISG